jgi:phage portal protein BeeE
MGWFSNLFGSIPWRNFGADENQAFHGFQEKASAAGPAMAAYFVGQPVWTPRDYAALSDEAFVRNAVAYRCVKLIASSAAAVPWLLTDRAGKEIEDHPLLSLLRAPLR